MPLKLYPTLTGLVLLLAAGLAMGSKLAGANVEGLLTLDQARATAGQTVTAQLKITALGDEPKLGLKIIAIGNCATLLSEAMPKLVPNVKKGDVIVARAQFIVNNDQPCLIAGEVVSAEGANYRYASPFGSMLNAGPPVSDNSQPGTTGDGRPTADFQSPATTR